MSLETIKIKKLNDNATIPTRSHATDAGLDLYASEDVRVARGTKIPTGIAVDIPPGYEAQVRPRSGLSVKSDLRVIIGTIDSGFTGEINVIADTFPIRTTLEELSLGNMYVVHAGDKIAQLIVAPIETPIVEVVETFDGESERGDNGFGSTDK